jgi:thioredoxin-related protein
MAVSLDIYGAEGGEGWTTDFEAAKKMAAEKKLPILAEFSGSDWCVPCIKLKREVFSSQEFKDYAKDNLVLFVADFPHKTKLDEKTAKQNDDLSKKYKIEVFPTVLLTDAEGKVFATTGYEKGGAAAYILHLKKLIAKSKTK